MAPHVRTMNSALIHRGPDAEGYLDDPTNGVFLGHRRLSIIDLSERANQPLYNEDKTVAVVCNGELYGYKDLQNELTKKGHTFFSKSDTEVFVHAYEEWGIECLKRFNGIFAAVIYDVANARAFLVRDQLGVKPLFYLARPNAVAFSSEIKALFKLPTAIWSPTLDMDTVSELLDFPHLLSQSKTVLHDVYMLPPATHLQVDTNIIRIHEPKRYWSVEYDPAVEKMDWHTACDAVEHALTLSINKQMAADVPVGILLSGGLDSSTVAALAQRNTTLPVRTFTATFNHALDERCFAKTVADHIASNHTEVAISPSDVNNRIEEIAYYYDDLRSVDGGLFSLYLIGELIRHTDIRVLLFGEGSDEIFGGYSWFGLSLKPFSLIPRFFRSSIHHYAVSRTFLRRSNWAHTSRFNSLSKSYGERDIFRQVSRMEIEHQLPNHYLMKVDKATMAHSLEGRVPYLDRDLVNLAFSLNHRFKYAGDWFSFRRPDEKYILKTVASSHLPSTIISRKKRGFLIPMSDVLRSNPDKVRAYVMDPGSLSRRLLPLRTIENLFSYTPSMYSPIHKEKEFLLWRCFMLDTWAKVYGLC